MAHLRAVHQVQPLPPTNPRIKDLEDEIRRLTVENGKIKMDLEKAQRRWERLKEGARRRGRERGNTLDEGGIPEEKGTEKE
jgi:hypothetical protein